MFSTKKAKNTVSEILADFQLKVTELRQLAERKAEEVQTTPDSDYDTRDSKGFCTSRGS